MRHASRPQHVYDAIDACGERRIYAERGRDCREDECIRLNRVDFLCGDSPADNLTDTSRSILGSDNQYRRDCTKATTRTYYKHERHGLQFGGKTDRLQHSEAGERRGRYKYITFAYHLSSSVRNNGEESAGKQDGGIIESVHFVK